MQGEGRFLSGNAAAAVSDRLVSSKRVGKVGAHSWGVSYHILVLSTEPLGQCSDTLPSSQCRALVRCLFANCMHCVPPHRPGMKTVCVEGRACC